MSTSSHCSSFFHTSESSHKRRWRIAYASIYSCRAIAGSILAKKKNPNEHLSVVSRIQSFTAIDMQETCEDGINLSAIDQESLTKIVTEKDVEALSRFGGVDGISVALNTDRERGISGDTDDLYRRRVSFGLNTYKKKPTKGFFFFVLEAINDRTLLVLLGCALLSLAFGIKEDGPKEGWYDGGSIFIAILLVVFVTAVSNFRQAKQFEKLSSNRGDIKVDVVRDGRRQEISILDLVAGDVVFLKIGDQIPADGLFLNGHSLQVDESSMTGESDHIDIDCDRNPFLSSGTMVVDGFGCMIITSVGRNTTWGQMMSSISCTSAENTPLQARLNELTACIGKIGLTIAFLVLSVLLVRYFTSSTFDENRKTGFDGKKKIDKVIYSLTNIFAAAIAILVVAIPEGLPLAVTLTLAYSMKRMIADQAMVRSLSACETMGSATTICTDKTGTLTQNQMKVTRFWLDEEIMEESKPIISSKVLELLHQGIGLNTTGSVYTPKSLLAPEFSGSPTERAILSWAVLELRMNMVDLKQNFNVLHIEAFNSDKKMSGASLQKNGEKSVHVHWKGAAEMILAMCSSYYDSNGIVKSMQEEKIKFTQIIEGMTANSLRCIAFAHKQIVEDDAGVAKKLPEESLTLLGIVGLQDPCRPGVRLAVQACIDAGVNIKMITGDNVSTARAIAIECGILSPDQELNEEAVILGEEFRNYSMEERTRKIDKICVMARSSPLDKLLMVKCLKQKGHVVAVTGDGANDAPALKEADIGLSMGIQGTDVAKESSDIVIIDDNFATVTTVLKWGRCVYKNIQKFIQFQLTVNVAALVINIIAAVSSGKVPLTTVQLLWVNLIMDTLGALALATERPTADLMEKRPIGRSEPLITNVMWRNLIVQALYQIMILLILQFEGESIFKVNEKVKRTLIFNTFVLCQVFNEFNARNMEKKNVFRGIHKNHLFLVIVTITIVLQVVMVELLGRFADTERLNQDQWCACVGIAALSWPIGWIAKCIPFEKPFPNLSSIKSSKSPKI
ncbi:calcium-transporting ATPase 12, plasma membrane-type-like [Magnolia sinica]|uniref:calcium-transporting ATPase 12, plasma membrane-type-like n=1 Tax=Magnolia sinica TaxID=86752 RepID=UPI0026586381|nr:calcium-transporting ATPase 12, plasma membrane-type-like [Magnolia sinica]